MARLVCGEFVGVWEAVDVVMEINSERIIHSETLRWVRVPGMLDSDMACLGK